MDRTGSPVSVAATTWIGATEAVSYPSGINLNRDQLDLSQIYCLRLVYALTSVAFVYDTYATDAGRSTSIAGCFYC